MARKIPVGDQAGSAEAAPRTQVQSIVLTELDNPMPLRTKLVLIIEPIILVVLGAALAVTDSLELGILAAVVLCTGPLTALYSDRKTRPSKVSVDNEGVTPHFGSRPATSIPWSIVVLIPRRRSSAGRTGGILVQEGRRMPYMVSDEVFEALADAYRKRVGKEPW